MLRPRLIPCLLVKDGGLVKTVNFRNPKYVGDPINAVRIFNEKMVDELMVLDIDATVNSREPDYRTIENLAAECRMPLCYGGGVRSVEQAQRIFELGVEKVAISTAAITDPTLIERIAEKVGSQSMVVILDVKRKTFGGYEIYVNNGKSSTGRKPAEMARIMENHGAGEIIINSIDHDGMMNGYDMELIARVRDQVKVPMSVLGGAGSLEDIGGLIRRFGIIGAAAGSLFVFKGIYKAVLINYPGEAEKASLIADNFII